MRRANLSITHPNNLLVSTLISIKNNNRNDGNRDVWMIIASHRRDPRLFSIAALTCCMHCRRSFVCCMCTSISFKSAAASTADHWARADITVGRQGRSAGGQTSPVITFLKSSKIELKSHDYAKRRMAVYKWYFFESRNQTEYARCVWIKIKSIYKFIYELVSRDSNNTMVLRWSVNMLPWDYDSN